MSMYMIHIYVHIRRLLFAERRDAAAGNGETGILLRRAGPVLFSRRHCRAPDRDRADFTQQQQHVHTYTQGSARVRAFVLIELPTREPARRGVSTLGDEYRFRGALPDLRSGRNTGLGNGTTTTGLRKSALGIHPPRSLERALR